MANQILFTPNDNNLGNDVKNRVMVGANCQGFTDKVFVIDLENLPDQYNPLNLPPNTIRVKYKSGVTPTVGDTQTLVDASNNIWDIEKSSYKWDSLFSSQSDLLEVLGGNTKNVTCMDWMFYNCSSLTRVELFSMENVKFDQAHQNFAMFQECTSLTTLPNFYAPKLTILGQCFYKCTSLRTVPHWNTSHITSMYNMFSYCTALETVPLFDMSNVTNCNYMFNNCTSLEEIPLFDMRSASVINSMFAGCVNVRTGALDLYNQLKNDPPSNYADTFYNCGINTETGAAELAQIPEDWK